MPSRRSILAPISRKPKSSSQQTSKQSLTHGINNAGKDVPSLANPAPRKARKQKSSSGKGMFSSWLDETPGYDEEEDSKTWEQPWSLPPTPLPTTFSLTPPFTFGANDKVDKPRSGKSVLDRKPADKPQRLVKTTQGRDASRKAKTQEVVSKSRPKVQKQGATVQHVAKLVKPSLPTTPAPVKFFTLPLEVRDKIYGHLLTSDTNITVVRGWTQCFGRYRGGLEPNILLACRQTYAEGIRILYSSNTFMYLIRDTGDPIAEALRPEGVVPLLPVFLEPPPLAELKAINSKGRAPKRQKKTKVPVKKSTVGDVNRVIYLAKYAHLLRRVEVVLESNRDEKEYGIAMAKAIKILGSGEGGVGAHLTSLQFSLKPRKLVREGEPDSEDGAPRDWTVVKFFTSAAAESNTATGADQTTRATEKNAEPRNVRDYGVMTALRNLDVRLLHFTVYTPSSRRLDMTLDMTYCRSTVGGTRNDLDSLLAHDSLISQQRRETASASAEAFNNLAMLIQAACEDTDNAVKDGWWTEYGPPQVAAVRSAMEGIETIKDKVRKYRTPWYQKLRDDFAAQPEHACCVRKIGRRLLPAAAAE